MKMILFVVFFFALSGAVYAPAAPKQETVVATPVKQAPVAFPQCEVDAAKRCLEKCKAHCNNGVGNGADCRPGRARRDNDDRCGVPGAPGNQGGGKLGTEYVTKEKGDNNVVNTELVFHGDLAGTWKRTECQDKCEDAEFAACEKPAAPAPTTCQLTPRSVAVCTAEAKKAENCDACVTSRCQTCRDVYIELCSKPKRRADLESCLKLSATARDVPRTRKAIAALCAEQTCAEKPAVEEPKEEPKPVVYGGAPKAEEPKVDLPVNTGNDPKVIIPAPIVPTCVQTQARKLKIRGTGKACEDAKALKEQIKKLKEQVNCILSAFEGKIPEVVTQVIKAPIVVEKVEKIVRADTRVADKDNREVAKEYVAKVAEEKKEEQRAVEKKAEAPKPAGYTAPVEKKAEAPKPAGYTAPVRGNSVEKKVEAATVVKAAAGYGGAVKVQKVRAVKRAGSRRRRNGRARGGSRRRARRGGARRQRNGRARRGGSRQGRARRGGGSKKGKYAKRGGSRGGSKRGGSRGGSKRGGSKRGGSTRGGSRGGSKRGGSAKPAAKNYQQPAPKPAAAAY